MPSSPSSTGSAGPSAPTPAPAPASSGSAAPPTPAAPSATPLPPWLNRTAIGAALVVATGLLGNCDSFRYAVREGNDALLGGYARLYDETLKQYVDRAGQEVGYVIGRFGRSVYDGFNGPAQPQSQPVQPIQPAKE